MKYPPEVIKTIKQYIRLTKKKKELWSWLSKKGVSRMLVYHYSKTKK